MTTTTLVVMRDAAWPSNLEPATAAELVYAGGDTPNPEIKDSSTARYQVPCWVRSNPGQVDPTTDAHNFVAWLHDNGVPQGTVTVLDLETMVAPAFVNTFGAEMHSFGYFVWVYGSKNFVLQNPPLDGYFVADPTGVEHEYPGAIATQYLAAGAYDLSVIDPGAPLWDTQPPLNPPTTPTPQENDMPYVAVATGEGAAAVDPVVKGDVYLVDAGTKQGVNLASDEAALVAKFGAAVQVSSEFLQKMPGQ